MAQIPILITTDRKVLAESINAIRSIRTAIDSVRRSLGAMNKDVKAGVVAAQTQAAKVGAGPSDIGGRIAKSSEKAKDALKRNISQPLKDIERQAKASSSSVANFINKQEQRIGGLARGGVGDKDTLLRSRFGATAGAQTARFADIGKLQESVRQMDALASQADRLKLSLPRIKTSFGIPDKDIKSMDALIGRFQKLRTVGLQNIPVIDRMRSAIGNFGDSVLRFVRFQLEFFAGAAIIFGTIAAIRGAVSAVVQFDQAMRNISAVTGSTNKEMALLSETTKNVSLVTPFTTKEIADMGLRLVQAGLSAKQASESMLTVAKVATISGEGLSQVADTITTAIFAFNISSRESARIGNVLAATLNFSRLTIGDLGTAFNFLASTAAVFGKTLEETTSIMAVFSNRGIKASTIGTGLSQLFTKLANPTGKFAAELERLVVNFSDVNPTTNDFADIVQVLSDQGFIASRSMGLLGQRAGRPLALAINATADSFRIMEERIENATQLTRGFDEAMKGLSNTAKITKNTLIVLAVNIAAPFLPLIKVTLDFIKDLGLSLVAITSSFGGMGATIITIIVPAFLAFGASMIPALAAIGRLDLALLAFGSLVIAGQITRILTGDKTAVQIQGEIDGIGKSVNKFTDTVSSATGKASTNLIGIILDMREALSAQFKTIPIDRVIPIQDVTPAIEKLIEARRDLIRTLSILEKFFKRDQTESFRLSIRDTKDEIAKLDKELKDVIPSAVTLRKVLVSDLADIVVGSGTKDLAFQLKAIEETMKEIRNLDPSAGTDQFETLKGKVNNALVAIGDEVVDVREKIKEMNAGFSNPDPVGDAERNFARLKNVLDIIQKEASDVEGMEKTRSKLKDISTELERLKPALIQSAFNEMEEATRKSAKSMSDLAFSVREVSGLVSPFEKEISGINEEFGKISDQIDRLIDKKFIEALSLGEGEDKRRKAINDEINALQSLNEILDRRRDKAIEDAGGFDKITESIRAMNEAIMDTQALSPDLGPLSQISGGRLGVGAARRLSLPGEISVVPDIKLESGLPSPPKETVSPFAEENERLNSIFDQQIGTVNGLSEAYTTLTDAFFGNEDAMKERNAQMRVGIFLQNLFVSAVASAILGEQKASDAIKRAAAGFIAAEAAKAAVLTVIWTAMGFAKLAMLDFPAAGNFFTAAAIAASVAVVAGVAARSINPGRSGAVGSPGNPAVTEGLGSSRTTDENRPIKVNLTVNALDPEGVDWDRVIGDVADSLGNHLGRGGSTGPVTLAVERN